MEKLETTSNSLNDPGFIRYPQIERVRPGWDSVIETETSDIGKTVTLDDLLFIIEQTDDRS